jgi:hypothetical protein
LIVAIVMTFVCLHLLNSREELVAGLASNGRTTTGSVTRVTETTRRGVSSFQIEYRYHVGSSTYTGLNNATREEALRTRGGDPITVTYSPDDPSRSIGTSLARAERDVNFLAPVIYTVIAVLWGFALWMLAAARNG